MDEVLEVEVGQSAKGLWTPKEDDWFFSGHFPGRPTLPGVLMVEAIAQLGAYLVLMDEKYESYLPLFGGIDKARFRRQVVPGETLSLEIKMSSMSARAGKGSGKAEVNGDGEEKSELACSVDLMFVLVPN